MSSFEMFDLLEAAKLGSFTVLQLALDHLDLYNFYIDSRDSDGNTLLHLVAPKDAETCKKILELGGDPGVPNNLRETALHSACSAGNLKSVQILVQYDAEIEAKNKSGEGATFSAVRGHHLGILEFFADKTNFEEMLNKQGDSLLHVAVKHRSRPDLQVIKYLLENFQFDLNQVNSSGDNVLISAIKRNDTKLVKYLLSHPGTPEHLINCRDFHGRSCLHLAVERNNRKMVEILINRGININSQDRNGETALHYATILNLEEIFMQLLLDGAVDVNLQDLDGYSPLHLCVEQENWHFCGLLISNGALGELRTTSNGDSALELAQNLGSSRCQLLLKLKTSPQKIKTDTSCTSDLPPVKPELCRKSSKDI